MKQLMLVGIGGAVGAIARWLIGGWLQHRAGDPAFPVGTLAVNLIGCLLAGVIAGLILRNSTFSPDLRLLLMTGVLGGFTTFSAFGVDTIYHLRRNEFGTAAAYVLISVLGGIAVLWIALTIVVRIPTRGA